MKSSSTIAIVFATSLLLVSCGKVAEEAPKPQTKTDFRFTSVSAASFWTSASVEKIGRVTGTSTVTVTSQGAGRVSKLSVKEGQSIGKGGNLAVLSDSVSNYGIRLYQAQNSVKNADSSVATTKLSLDKAVSDAELALERAKIDHVATMSDARVRLEKAERDSKKSDLSNAGSDSSVSFEKAKLDLENLKKSNAKTIENYAPTFRLQISDLKKLVASVLFDTDRLVGITDANRPFNDSFETYLGARDSSIRPKVENAYARVLEVSKFLESKSAVTAGETELQAEYDLLSPQYRVVRELLDLNAKLLENSISASTFSQSTIDGYLATHNGYKSSLSGLENGFVAFKNASSAFLSTYKNGEASAAAALEVQSNSLATGQYDAGISFERAKISIEREIENSKIALETAERNLENAKKNRAVTIDKLAVSRDDASLGLRQAQVEAGKLTVESPIDATVVRVIAQVGQEVSTGTPLFEISSRNPEILLDVDSNTAGLLKLGSSVTAKVSGETLTGTVVALSKVANSSLLFSARIVLSKAPALFGEAATVVIPLPGGRPLLSVDIVKILSEQSGELTVFSGGTFESLPVKLGKTSLGTVEILSEIPKESEIVTSDVSNYDAKRNVPVKRQ